MHIYNIYLHVCSYQQLSGSTTAPLPLTESDLIARMDENGIGTDATISTHIGTIQKREYAIKDANGMFHATPLGMGLVEGYNDMGYQLNKPYMRASMERDMMKIARGELSKDEMMRACMESMQKCYFECKTQISKLNDSMDRYIGADGGLDADDLHVVKHRVSTCGDCGSKMDMRIKEDGHREVRYLYCARCTKLNQIPSNGEISAHEHICPICNFQVLSVQNIETEKTHTICPRCFKSPPPAPMNIEDGGGDFRCFQCAHPTCALAGNTPAFAPCPECPQGSLKLKKTNSQPPKTFAGCSDRNCKYKGWWMPVCVRSVSVQSSKLCQRCTAKGFGNVYLLALKVCDEYL